MKRLITVCWSVTIVTDVPDNLIDVVGVDLNSPVDCRVAAVRIVDEAWSQVQRSNGEITDCQDIT